MTRTYPIHELPADVQRAAQREYGSKAEEATWEGPLALDVRYHHEPYYLACRPPMKPFPPTPDERVPVEPLSMHILELTPLDDRSRYAMAVCPTCGRGVWGYYVASDRR